MTVTRIVKAVSFITLMVITFTLPVLIGCKADAQVTVPVRVTNPESGPVPTRSVDNPANEPFSAATCSANNTGGTAAEPCPPDLHPSFVVPTTVSGKTVKRLVIEYVSGHCDATRPDTYVLDVYLSVDAALASGRIHHLVPILLPNVSGAGNAYAIAQQTRVYVNPGKAVDVTLAQLRGASDNWDVVCNFQIDGSLVTQ